MGKPAVKIKGADRARILSPEEGAWISVSDSAPEAQAQPKATLSGILSAPAGDEKEAVQGESEQR